MKNIEAVLYKMSVVKGKEAIAKEWLAFLSANKKRAVEILIKEKAYYEAYFISVENDTMYIYMTLAVDDIENFNLSTWNSKDKLNIKHFEYLKSCIDREKSFAITADLEFNTF